MFARGVRNVIYNYTDAQRKVRSATSNDAWGPSPALMHEIADLTDNVVAYAEIMPIIWKRLNDHGKNWRHVYKSLVLLDHLIKYGNERVSQQCKENIFAIQTLKDFQYVEDQKDQGYNVREKAKQLVALLKDDERLRNERRKAQEARERYSRQAMGMDSSGTVMYGRPTPIRRNSAEGGDSFSGTSYPSSPYATNLYTHRSSSFNEGLHGGSGKDFVQPANQEEEQIQMQIALAESQREAEEEERRRRNDDLKLKIALERSVTERSTDIANSQDSYLPSNIKWNLSNPRPSTHLGFTSVTNDPWQAVPSSSSTQVNPWGESNPTAGANTDTGLSVNIADPWGIGLSDSQATSAKIVAKPTATDLPSVATTAKSINNELKEFFGASASTSTHYDQQQQASSNPWNMPSTNILPTSTTTTTNINIIESGSISSTHDDSNASNSLLYPTVTGRNDSSSNNPSPLPSTSRKTPESFLGEGFSNLVDLDELVPHTKNTNPFGLTAPRTQNPFANTMKPPTLEQLSSSNNGGFTADSTLPPPLIPSSLNANTSSTNLNNPFM